MDHNHGTEYGTLEEIYKLTKENNQILHGMRRSQRWASVMRLVYWIIIIGISVGAYYYIQPYTDKILSLYNQNQGVFNDLKSLTSKVGDSSQIKNLFDQFNQIQGKK